MKKGDNLIVFINGITFEGILLENNGDTVMIEDKEGKHIRVHKVACRLKYPHFEIQDLNILSTDKEVNNTTIFTHWEAARKALLDNALQEKQDITKRINHITSLKK